MAMPSIPTAKLRTISKRSLVGIIGNQLPKTVLNKPCGQTMGEEIEEFCETIRPRRLIRRFAVFTRKRVKDSAPEWEKLSDQVKDVGKIDVDPTIKMGIFCRRGKIGGLDERGSSRYLRSPRKLCGWRLLRRFGVSIGARHAGRTTSAMSTKTVFTTAKRRRFARLASKLSSAALIMGH